MEDQSKWISRHLRRWRKKQTVPATVCWPAPPKGWKSGRAALVLAAPIACSEKIECRGEKLDPRLQLPPQAWPGCADTNHIVSASQAARATKENHIQMEQTASRHPSSKAGSSGPHRHAWQIGSVYIILYHSFLLHWYHLISTICHWLSLYFYLWKYGKLLPSCKAAPRVVGSLLDTVDLPAGLSAGNSGNSSRMSLRSCSLRRPRSIWREESSSFGSGWLSAARSTISCMMFLQASSGWGPLSSTI